MLLASAAARRRQQAREGGRPAPDHGDAARQGQAVLRLSARRRAPVGAAVLLARVRGRLRRCAAAERARRAAACRRSRRTRGSSSTRPRATTSVACPSASRGRCGSRAPASCATAASSTTPGTCRFGYGTCFEQLDVAEHPFGRGNKARPLIPFKSVAIDPRLVPIGEPLYIPEFDGMVLPMARSTTAACAPTTPAAASRSARWTSSS